MSSPEESWQRAGHRPLAALEPRSTAASTTFDTTSALITRSHHPRLPSLPRDAAKLSGLVQRQVRRRIKLSFEVIIRVESIDFFFNYCLQLTKKITVSDSNFLELKLCFFIFLLLWYFLQLLFQLVLEQRSCCFHVFKFRHLAFHIIIFLIILNTCLIKSKKTIHRLGLKTNCCSSSHHCTHYCAVH